MHRFTLRENGTPPAALRLATTGTLALLIATAVGACSSSGPASTPTPSAPAAVPAAASGPRGSASVGDIKITGAYIPQPATPSIAAAYFLVTETGSQQDVLLSATSNPSAQAALMQETETGAEAGTMTNISGGLPIPAKGAVDLGPGGYHLMLDNPASPLIAGGSVALTLRFEHAGTVTFKVPVTSLLSDALTGPAPSASLGMTNMPGM
jgi:hypothetical protein